MIKIGDLNINKLCVGDSEVSKVYLGDTEVYSSGPAPEPAYSAMPLTFEIISGGTISWMINSSSAPAKTISYSVDNGSTWTNITSSTAGTSFNVNDGDTVMFKGDNTAYSNRSNLYNSFSGTTAIFSIEGNIMSLIDSTGFTSATTLSVAYALNSLFRNCTGLKSAENLVLPATTLTDGCYYMMFTNCRSLTTAPSILPATTLTNYSYYQMFSGCASLTTAPELPASTLKTNCYYQMFYSCSSLNYIKCLATDISASNCTSNWVSDVAASGIFVKAASMTGWTNGAKGIPWFWTVIDA